ncbi:MAG: Proline hydroxylase [uncultured Aureispira sp.]|uniref:Proline hydroxylase n=1 Tax=uncultured Aureispira sp. TaxID=1331704 RepID=A0A6S6UJL6_9BACT|nr:MAG: Proline hydroxylase [uncultured Aureispira sp.]
MDSQIIGQINFNEVDLKKDIQTINNFQFSDAYSEFRSGTWKTCTLWNFSGLSGDSLLYEYRGVPQKTEMGMQLPYINQIIEKIFCTEKIQIVRVVCSENNGLIFPHRDYLDLENGFTRVHIPLMIDENCMNTERDTVFSMRKGEIWYLEARVIHSAGSFLGSKKYSLVLDFLPNTPIKELFKDLSYYNTNVEPLLIERSPLTEEELDSILNLKHLINEANFMDIATILAKVPFFKNVTNETFFWWLNKITAGSNNPTLVKKAKKMKNLFLEEKEELYQPVK